MNYQEFFKDKKVTQLGLGLLGRGLNDAIFMLENGVADLIVTDKKTAEELAPSVEKLKGYKNITLRLGEHRLEDFENRDFILKGAGVPLNSEYIAHAKERGIPIEMDSSLCVKLLPSGVRTIGITGTRGKSTVTHMIYEALEGSMEGICKVYLGGNIRDMATLNLLPQIKSGDIVVLELDSWQLQGFGEAKISPNIAVFTNLMSDHQNYYGDMETYFKDKANIFLYQKPGDRLIVGQSVLDLVKKMNPPVEPVVPEPLPKEWVMNIPGAHNRENAALAREVIEIPEKYLKNGPPVGVSLDNYFIEPYETYRSLSYFKGVEGRLQFVREINDVKIYNDNNATTPEATIAALKALDPEGKKKIVLIGGGADKGSNITPLVIEIARSAKKVILLTGTGTDRLKESFPEASVFGSIKETVDLAIKEANKGDIILFSPGFASFGLFKNEYDRNDQFLKIVGEL